MTARFQLSLLTAFLLSTPAFALTPTDSSGSDPASAGCSASRSRAGTRKSPSEFRGLRSIEDAGLGRLRAGVSPAPAPIQAAERSTLEAAASRASDLGEMRGGDLTLSDHDIQLIVIVAAVVLILVII